MNSITNSNQTNNTPGELKKGDPSILLTSCFAGLGTGFMAFWLTLALLYSGALCVFGAPLVWLFVREMKGTDLANSALVIYLFSAIIGIVVGLASSFGSGIPVSIM